MTVYYEQLIAQFPILAICAILGYFLFSKIEKLQDKVTIITEKSVEAIINNTNALNDLKEIIQKLK